MVDGTLPKGEKFGVVQRIESALSPFYIRRSFMGYPYWVNAIQTATR